MRRIISIALCTVMLCIALPVMAEENTTEVEYLHEKLNYLIMEENFTTEQIEEMDKAYTDNYTDWFWNTFLPQTKKIGKMVKENDEEEYQYRLSKAKLAIRQEHE